MSGVNRPFLKIKLSVPTLADLLDRDTSGLESGDMAFVQSANATTPYYCYLPTSAATVSSPDIVAAANGGRWVRLDITAT